VASFKSEVTICPFCKEEISVGAIKCKHCQSNLAPISDNYGQAGNTKIENVVNYSSGPQQEKYLGHGWGVVVIAVLVFILTSAFSEGEYYEPDAAIGVALLGMIPVLPYGIWIISRDGSNKALPAIGMILSLFTFIASLGV